MSFGLPAGSGLLVLGRNGSGKSTLLRTVAGLLPAAAGCVRLGGVDVHGMAARERARHMAFVASSPPRQSSLTVEDVIELALEAGGQRSDADALAAALESSGIIEWRGLALNALSDGMAQRVMTARAAIQADAVLLLDEPTAFLDVVGRRDVMHSVSQWRQAGRTIIMATHDLEAAESHDWVDHWCLLRPPDAGGVLIMQGGYSADRARELLLDT